MESWVAYKFSSLLFFTSSLLLSLAVLLASICCRGCRKNGTGEASKVSMALYFSCLTSSIKTGIF